MFSSAATLSALLLFPAVFGQNATTDSSTTNKATTTPTSGTPPSTANGSGTPFTVPTVTGTTCGTAQQNFNQCVTKVGKDISNCPPTDNVCLCQTYANIAACYNACPDLQDGATYKDQSLQYCATAKISPPSIYNQTSPVVNTTTTTPTTTPATTTPSRTNTTTSPVTTASTFARASDASTFGYSSALFGITTGLCAILFL